MSEEYEVRTYQEYPRGYDNQVTKRYAYRFCDGRIWLTVYEMADRLHFEEEEVQKAIEHVLTQISSQDSHVRDFTSKLITNNHYRIKCYDWKVLQGVMQLLNAKNKQFLLWVKSESGADKKHDYERLLKRETKHRLGLTEGYRFNCFDRLWYEYELAQSNHSSLLYGGALPFIYGGGSIIMILFGLGVPWYVALILYVILIVFLPQHFNRKRQAAIKVHYGHIDKHKNIILLSMIPWLVLIMSIFLAAYLNKSN